MKCLVTGHKGFIGKNLVSRLKKEGYEVLVLEKDDIEGFEKSIFALNRDNLKKVFFFSLIEKPTFSVSL